MRNLVIRNGEVRIDQYRMGRLESAQVEIRPKWSFAYIRFWTDLDNLNCGPCILNINGDGCTEGSIESFKVNNRAALIEWRSC